MKTQEVVSRISGLADEFNEHEHRSDGPSVIESICGGLTLIRDSVYARIHADVERRMGIDSLFYPLSEEKSERTTKLEIEIYQVVVAADAVQANGYVADANWFREWLSQLRLGEMDSNSRAALRISYYASKSAKDQRLAFGNVLAAVLPETGRSPLIMLRLLPQAVQIATALAFGRSAEAEALRHEQLEILPSISDCDRCHGKVLNNGEQCAKCGNPLWTYDWLNMADG